MPWSLASRMCSPWLCCPKLISTKCGTHVRERGMACRRRKSHVAHVALDDWSVSFSLATRPGRFLKWRDRSSSTYGRRAVCLARVARRRRLRDLLCKSASLSMIEVPLKWSNADGENPCTCKRRNARVGGRMSPRRQVVLLLLLPLLLLNALCSGISLWQ